MPMDELAAGLRELEGLWRRAGMPVDEIFGPGLDQVPLRRALEDAGLRATKEIVAWFVWHNGRGSAAWRAELGPSGWAALSLGEALTERASRLEGAIELAEDFDDVQPSFYWEPTWLPVADDGGEGALAVELDPERGSVDVRVVGWDDNPRFRTVRATSLNDVVRLWITLLDTGNWTWSPEVHRWIGDYMTVPDDIKALGLM